MGNGQGAVATLVLSAPERTRPAGGRALRVGFGFLVTVVFVWVFARRLSWAEIEAAVRAADLAWVPVAVGCVAAGYGARVTRWWLMLRPADSSLRWREAAAPFLVSIAVNNVAPLRAGDVLRLFAFRDRPALGPARVLGTVIVERLLDLAALLGVFFAVLPGVPAGGVPGAIVDAAALAAGVGAVLALALVLLPRLGDRVLTRAAGMRAGGAGLGAKLIAATRGVVDGVRALGAGGRLVAIVGLSAVAWAFEGGVFIAVAAALSLPGGTVAGLFALALGTLSTLLPSSPGYVGTFHVFAAAAVAAFGARRAAAAAFALLAHLVLWATTSFAGLVAFLLPARRAPD